MINFNLGEILKEVGIVGLIAGIMDMAKDAFRNGVKKVGDGVVAKITKELEEEKRAEMLAFIRSLAAIDLKASKQLLKRQMDRQECKARTYGDNKPYVPGDENSYVKLLTKLYIALSKPDEQNTRVQVFVWLGNLDDEEFDSRLEFLSHDVVLQYAKLLLAKVKVLIDQFDQTAAGLAIGIDEKVQNPSRFGKLANWLIK